MSAKRYLDYAGLQEFLAKLTQKYGVALQFKGTVQNIAALPDVTAIPAVTKQGYVYNVAEEGETTQDFIEGTGHILRAGSNVCVVNVAAEGAPEVLKYDILAGFFSVDDKLTFGDVMPANPADGDTFLYMGETTYTYEAVSGLTGAENPKELGYFEESGGVYTLTNDTEPLQVYKAFKDSTDTYFVKSATPQVGDTVYTISGGTVIDSGLTVDAVGTDDITVSGVTYARSAADDEYIEEKVYYDNKTEQYVTGVIYVYDQSAGEWTPQTAGDTYVPITTAEIDALFD